MKKNHHELTVVHLWSIISINIKKLRKSLLNAFENTYLCRYYRKKIGKPFKRGVKNKVFHFTYDQKKIWFISDLLQI